MPADRDHGTAHDPGHVARGGMGEEDGEVRGPDHWPQLDGGHAHANQIPVVDQSRLTGIQLVGGLHTPF
eukprot:937-Lingulodinium_polyedra.AAC.1